MYPKKISLINWLIQFSLLTAFKVKIFAHVHAYQSHQLKLTKTLSGTWRQRQKISKKSNLLIDTISSMFGRSFGRFDSSFDWPINKKVNGFIFEINHSTHNLKFEMKLKQPKKCEINLGKVLSISFRLNGRDYAKKS